MMKQYFLAMMQGGAWFHRDTSGDVCMGNHADIHRFLNTLNPLLTEHFDNAMEGLIEKESEFIRLRDFEFCLTRLS